MDLSKFDIRSKQVLPRPTVEEMTALAASVGLTAEQLKLIHIAANDAWSQIAYDVGEARELAGDGEDTTDRAEVVELVLDTDRLSNSHYLIDQPELKRWLRVGSFQYPLDTLYRAVGAGFPYVWYE